MPAGASFTLYGLLLTALSTALPGRHRTPPHAPAAPLRAAQGIIPTIVPGLVFGILSVLGFIFFSLWLCTQCCGRQRRVRASPDKAQLIAPAEQQVRRAGRLALCVVRVPRRLGGLVWCCPSRSRCHPDFPPARPCRLLRRCRAPATRRRRWKAGGSDGRDRPSSSSCCSPRQRWPRLASVPGGWSAASTPRTTRFPACEWPRVPPGGPHSQPAPTSLPPLDQRPTPPHTHTPARRPYTLLNTGRWMCVCLCWGTAAGSGCSAHVLSCPPARASLPACVKPGGLPACGAADCCAGGTCFGTWSTG